jgi:hypothetical protein
MPRFGVGKAEWHPYWKTKPLATAQSGSAQVSLPARLGAIGENRLALLVASNLSADQPATAQVTLDFARIGRSAKTATDALSSWVALATAREESRTS